MTQQILAHFSNGHCSFCKAPGHDGDAVSIEGSVGRGGRNKSDDVSTVQEALNDVPASDGGPTLALTVDGIAGPLTIAAIEKYQRKHLGWCDGRVDPAGPTIHALNGGGGNVPPGKAKPAAPIPPAATDKENKEFVAKVGTRLPIARHWVHRAMFTLDMAIDANSDVGNSLFPLRGLAEYGLVDKYYHIQHLSRPQRRHYMHDLKRVFMDMDVVISQSIIGDMLVGYGCGFFQPDPSDGKKASTKYDAFTFFGGWNAHNRDGKPRMSKQDNYTGANLREDTIFFPVSHYANKTDEYVTAVVIHELAHFVGPGVNSNLRIGDHSDANQKNFLKLDSFTAKRTADIYAHFAAESALGRQPMIFKQAS